ncbi:unnamed protein product [Darwinula stevensoni]|uniref:Sulfotransferase domain-containing protein n=1 Tax=Darwinula stevensoni TaxID=69355 RepID=A0A7R8ZYT6_9CRUS|nr:unnamed protein product [Darwinula stevensoni]CAG0882163.1 unnamed protein product [Darwinula stevensoni]
MSNVEFYPLEGSLVPRMEKHLFLYRKFVRSWPDGYVMNAYFPKFHKQMQDFELRQDDIFIITFPRSGTTWGQELIWNILHGVDLEAAKEKLMSRSPFWEYDGLLPPRGVLDVPKEIMQYFDKEDPTYLGRHSEFMAKVSSPRLIKTHLPLSLLPDQVKERKVIYIARNPKDVCVSYYHLFRTASGFIGSFDDFVDYFLEDMSECLLRSGRLTTRSCFKYFFPGALNLQQVIYRISSFLDRQLTSEQVHRLMNHVSFENMKNNKAVAFESNFSVLTQKAMKLIGTIGSGIQFLRTGKVGGWKCSLTKDQNMRFNRYIREHFSGTGLPYKPDDI